MTHGHYRHFTPDGVPQTHYGSWILDKSVEISPKVQGWLLMQHSSIGSSSRGKLNDNSLQTELEWSHISRKSTFSKNIHMSYNIAIALEVGSRGSSL
jgi:hypothetical protein